MKLKILSWNIWIDCNFEQVKKFLKSSNADIIGLQEVLDNDPKRDVIKFFNKQGYNYVYAPIKKVWGSRTWSDGPAIFTKHKIIKSETYVLSKEEARAAARADIQIDGKILHVFVTHLVHTHQIQSANQDEQADNLIKLLPKENTIVIGDFNATPDSSVITQMRKTLTDSDPKSLPTWSVYPQGCPTCNPQDINIRLDYIFLTRDIKFLSSKVEFSKASDHLPVSAKVNI